MILVHDFHRNDYVRGNFVIALQSSQSPVKLSLFVTGATGYVGGRLVPDLLEAGYSVRCLAREPRKLDNRPWRSHPDVDVVTGDISDVEQLTEQLRGCLVAYYLVHSMEASYGEYAERDRLLASNFAQAAARAGVERIIYLGGLGEMGPGLSEHLRSRREVEERLASTGVPVTTFRAAMIIGAGSASFEILRYLVERLPVMVTPSWVKTPSQPVAITDVLHWLVRCLSVPETKGKTLEIGGPDVLPYHDLMQIMAEELHLTKRWIITLPVLTPRLSSLWISLVTPVSYRIARPLGEGLRNRVVVTNPEAQQLMPHETLGVREAIREAIHKTEANEVETRWSAAGAIPGDPQWAGGTVLTDQRVVLIKADPESVFAAVCRIGGGNGWYAGDILWRIRGWMDTVVGGPGLRRGRRHPEKVEFGEALDFWRVAGMDRDRHLSLRAEMKLPGKAMLNFDLEPVEDGQRTKLTMTARFRPKGLLGLLYWYTVLPLHNFVFGGMLKGIRKTAEAMHRVENCGNGEPTTLQGAPGSEGLEKDSGGPQTPSSPTRPAHSPGYARGRLWLGISTVGSLVTLSGAGLILGIPTLIQQYTDPSQDGLWSSVPPSLGPLMGLLSFILLYIAIHLPFDVIGGYLLPRAFGREHLPLPRYLVGLARGVITHGSILFVSAVVLLLGGKYGGIAGTVAAGAGMSLFLLLGRVAIASMMASLHITPSKPKAFESDDHLPIFMADSSDEGFTGGVMGGIRPRFHLIPVKWREVLSPEEFEIVANRRALAVKTGSWLRGRVVALLFTLVGLTLCACAVSAGPSRLGTVAGTIEFSLWFSLWSFVGLLTLPTLSRRGVMEVDERARAQGYPYQAIRKATRVLDELQDGEPKRSSLVESIFHPIPSVENRLEGPRIRGVLGFWDAARTGVYLSLAGLGLLGRAVHCNCGRPSLWALLPTD